MACPRRVTGKACWAC
ncbi:hypothetical protein FWK35_00029001 [Aphis craccivora]|uniref:Uncharacterized protein n=1 Tax=Aphis craccivora TaxID=307492 RepID=A0A6G0XI69_APHCR|nr:hypothetical protein FWK35_00029001 [Aphis craccivora]